MGNLVFLGLDGGCNESSAELSISSCSLCLFFRVSLQTYNVCELTPSSITRYVRTMYVCIFRVLPADHVAFLSFQPFIAQLSVSVHTPTSTYIHIYIYMCVCVCTSTQLPCPLSFFM